jgi:hypothetical protein
MSEWSTYTLKLDAEEADRITVQSLYESLYFIDNSTHSSSYGGDKELVLAIGVVLDYKVVKNKLPEGINAILNKYGSVHVNEGEKEAPSVPVLEFTGSRDVLPIDAFEAFRAAVEAPGKVVPGLARAALGQVDLEDYIKEHYSE